MANYSFFNEPTIEKWLIYQELLQDWSETQKEGLAQLANDALEAAAYDESDPSGYAESYNQYAMKTLRHFLFGNENEE